MAVKGLISYWWLPIISAVVWLGMLLTMLLWWIIRDHHQPYDYQDPSIRIVYISNVGADVLQPLFIAGSAVSCLFLDLAMLADRWLRHRGRLVPNVSRGEKCLAVLTVVFAAIGTAGLILLSIFDTKNHHRLHYLFLLFFLAGYMLSAICTCWEYQRLGIKNRQHRDLRISFWVKLTIALVSIALAVVFVATNFTGKDEAAAVLEWAVAFLFTAFILSFLIDLYPAAATKPHAARYEKRGNPHDMEEAGGAGGVTTPPQQPHYNGNAPNATGAF